MRCKIVLLAVILFAFSALAQGYELRYVLSALDSAAVEGATVWDFGSCAVEHDDAPFFARISRGVLFEYTGERCRAYALAGDSILYRGFNIGRHTRLLVSGSALARGTESSYFSEYEAYGIDAAQRPFIIEGSVGGIFIKEGVAVFRGDSVAARLYRESHSEVTSVDDCVVDSAETILYKWIARGDSVPFAIERLGRDNSALICADFSEIESPDTIESNENNDSFLDEAEIELFGRTLHVGIGGSPSNCTIEISVVDIEGLPCGFCMLEVPANEYVSAELDLSGARAGRTVVSMRIVGKEDSERKILLTL